MAEAAAVASSVAIVPTDAATQDIEMTAGRRFDDLISRESREIHSNSPTTAEALSPEAKR